MQRNSCAYITSMCMYLVPYAHLNVVDYMRFLSSTKIRYISVAITVITFPSRL